MRGKGEEEEGGYSATEEAEYLFSKYPNTRKIKTTTIMAKNK